ncbi:hypothetical protein AWB80_08205 [Caballeronia pedi]|uniref:Uncharacterized protein n=1 Tax=Caballeronia pedi TaxID=1777141 RepID=A0A158E4F9_9BURK|nr:hypothetical protein AWB80_08205 [Caballeronia pedi]
MVPPMLSKRPRVRRRNSSQISSTPRTTLPAHGDAFHNGHRAYRSIRCRGSGGGGRGHRAVSRFQFLENDKSSLLPSFLQTAGVSAARSRSIAGPSELGLTVGQFASRALADLHSSSSDPPIFISLHGDDRRVFSQKASPLYPMNVDANLRAGPPEHAPRADRLVAFTASTASTSSRATHHECCYKQDEKDDEENLRNAGSASRNSTEAKNRCDQGDNQKNYGIVQHVLTSSNNGVATDSKCCAKQSEPSLFVPQLKT